MVNVLHETWPGMPGELLDNLVGQQGTTWQKAQNLGPMAAVYDTGVGLRCDSGPDAIYYLNIDLPTADYRADVECIAYTRIDEDYAGALVRADATADTGAEEQFYRVSGGVVTDRENDWVYLVKRLGGTTTELAGIDLGVSGMGSAPRQFGLSASGSTIEAFIDNVLVASVTDSAIAGPGCPGVVFGIAAGADPYPAGTGTHITGFIVDNLLPLQVVVQAAVRSGGYR